MNEPTQPTDEALFNALKDLIVEAQAVANDHHRPRYARLDQALASARNALLGYWATPQPTQAQAGAVPLDEARRLFDAGWKAAALFCDREDVVADGIIGFGACPQFEAAFSAAHGIKGGQHGAP